jgi:hypothetical protein
MKMIVILFAVVALIGCAWYFLTQEGLIPAISFPINIFDKETISAWFFDKIKEISEFGI